MTKIEVKISTNSKYGRFRSGDVLEVGKDVPEKAATRWLNVGIAKATDKKETPEKPQDEKLSKPTSDNFVKEIKAYLDQENIEYKSNETKPELLAKV